MIGFAGGDGVARCIGVELGKREESSCSVGSIMSSRIGCKVL